MSSTNLSRPPWRLKAACLAVALLLPAATLSQSLASSKDLTKKLLNMDLGYTVLNSEMLRKSIGVSVDTLDDLDDDGDDDGDDHRVGRGGARFDDDDERLPRPQHLIRDEDVFRYGGPNADGLWSDEKFWGPGIPQFFGSAFGGNPSPRPASAQRHGGAVRRPPQVRSDQPKKRQVVGDQHQCGSGSCEFFLFCWLSGGTVEGTCGGFVFACCKRPQLYQNYEESPKVIAAPQVRFLPTKPSGFESRWRHLPAAPAGVDFIETCLEPLDPFLAFLLLPVDDQLQNFSAA